METFEFQLPETASADIGDGTADMIGSIWPVVAMIVGIILALYIADYIVDLFSDKALDRRADAAADEFESRGRV